MLRPRTFGQTLAERCERCEGVWIETRHFNDLVIDIDRQAAILAELAAGDLIDDAGTDLPCVRCGAAMPRRDFACRTGVFVNACRRHGMWLDRGELRLVVELLGTLGRNTTLPERPSRAVAPTRSLDDPGWFETFLEALVDVLAWLNRPIGGDR